MKGENINAMPSSLEFIPQKNSAAKVYSAVNQKYRVVEGAIL